MRWLIVVALSGCTVTEDEIEITQTTSDAITDGIQCAPDGTGLEISYYRAFPMPRGGFQLDAVSFGIAATPTVPHASSITEPVHVILWAYTGPVGGDTLDFTARTMITDAIAMFAAGTESLIVPVPIPVVVTSPALLVEIYVDNSGTPMQKIELGANSQGETAQSYVKSFKCTNDALQTGQQYTNTATTYAFVIYLTGSTIPYVGEHPPNP